MVKTFGCDIFYAHYKASPFCSLY